MVIIICPECGVTLDSEKVDFEVHCKNHWHVDYKRLDTLRNGTARARYEEIMNTFDAEV